MDKFFYLTIFSLNPNNDNYSFFWGVSEVGEKKAGEGEGGEGVVGGVGFWVE